MFAYRRFPLAVVLIPFVTELSAAQGQVPISRVVTSGSSGNGENLAPGVGSPSPAVFQALGTAPNNFGNSPRLNNSGQVTFSAYFGGAGSNVSTFNDSGLWMQNGSGLVLMAREGSSAVGTGGLQYGDLASNLTFAPINDSGKIAFVAPLNNGSRAAFSTQNGNLGLVAQTGTAAPGTAGQFTSLNANINNQGTVLVSGLTNVGTGLWAQAQGGGLVKMAAAGDSAAGLSGVTFATTGRTQGIVDAFNDNGIAAYQATLTGSGVTSSNNSSLWTQQAGSTPQLALREGDSLGGGSSYVLSSSPVGINNLNQVWTNAAITHSGIGTTAIITNRSGAYAVDLKAGDVAPDTGGLTFKSDGSLQGALTDSGLMVVTSRLNGAGVVPFVNETAVFSEAGGNGLRMVARAGEQAPGTTGAAFSTVGTGLVFNNGGQVAFIGTLQAGVGDTSASPPNEQGIWATDPFGSLALVARREMTELPFTDATSNPANVSWAFHDMRINGFNDAGQLLFTTASQNEIATATFIADLGSANVANGVDLVLDNGQEIDVPGTVTVGTDDTGGSKSKLSIALDTKVTAEKNVLVKSDGQLNVDGELKAARVDVYGELAVKGSIVSDVYLGDGAILSGTGEILGTVFANDGSILSVGNSPGILNPGDFDFTGGTVNFRFEVAAAAGDDSLAGINWDFLNVDGTLTFADSTNVVIQIVSGDFDTPFAVADWNPSQNYRWLFMQANEILGFHPSKFTFDLAALSGFDLLNPADGRGFSVRQESNRLYIEFTPTTNSSVPEPGSLAIFGISGFAILLGQYRPFRRP